MTTVTPCASPSTSVIETPGDYALSQAAVAASAVAVQARDEAKEFADQASRPQISAQKGNQLVLSPEDSLPYVPPPQLSAEEW